MAVHWASSAEAQDFPRTKIYLYKYGGAYSEEKRNALNDFEVMIRDRLVTLSEEILEEWPNFDYFSHLSITRVMDSRDQHIEFQGSLADLKRKWQERGTLELLTGRIRGDNAPFVARSRIYLGELGEGLGSRPIKFDLLIDPDKFECARDSHTVITLYALAMDAASRADSGELSRYLLQRASVYAEELPISALGIRRLRDAILTALEQGRSQYEPGQRVFAHRGDTGNSSDVCHNSFSSVEMS